jgi:hypothetical protein
VGSSPTSRTIYPSLSSRIYMSSTPLKVVFAPGAFDTFEGTQEELDQLIADITETFGNMTTQELAEQSRSICLEAMADDLDANPDVVDAMLAQTGRSRRLQ